jgi:hypothetical protein
MLIFLPAGAFRVSSLVTSEGLSICRSMGRQARPIIVEPSPARNTRFGIDAVYVLPVRTSEIDVEDRCKHPHAQNRQRPSMRFVLAAERHHGATSFSGWRGPPSPTSTTPLIQRANPTIFPCFLVLWSLIFRGLCPHCHPTFEIGSSYQCISGQCFAIFARRSIAATIASSNK